MPFGESYSPDQVDEIKQESSNLVTEKTDNNESEKIENWTVREGEKVVDMDNAQPENQENSEDDSETLESFNNHPDLAEKEAEKIIKENLPDAIKHLSEDEQKKFANSIEQWVIESGIDLPIDTVPENWWKSLKEYTEVAKNKSLLTSEQQKALDDVEKEAIKDMSNEAKEKVLSGIMSESMPGFSTKSTPESTPDSPSTPDQGNPNEESNPEWWLD